MHRLRIIILGAMFFGLIGCGRRRQPKWEADLQSGKVVQIKSDRKLPPPLPPPPKPTTSKTVESKLVPPTPTTNEPVVKTGAPVVLDGAAKTERIPDSPTFTIPPKPAVE